MLNYSESYCGVQMRRMLHPQKRDVNIVRNLGQTAVVLDSEVRLSYFDSELGRMNLWIDGNSLPFCGIRQVR